MEKDSYEDMTVAELEELQKRISSRIRTLKKEAYDKLMAESWEWVKHAKNGEVFYVTADIKLQHSYGPLLRRGDKVKVYVVQPRKKIMWVIADKTNKVIPLMRGTIHRLQLRPDPPKRRK